MAYSSYANLTFTGGELNIKDLTAGTNGAYLVKATEGGSIIFDNTVVDIGAGNNTTSSIGLQSAGQGSKISFGKNVEQLTIKSATGIVVEGGGSLEFNSVDGIINIGRDEGSKKGHDGIRVGTFSVTNICIPVFSDPFHLVNTEPAMSSVFFFFNYSLYVLYATVPLLSIPPSLQ